MTRPRRSAFAAAFLSFVFPGLGQAYLGRWIRAALWAFLPVLALSAVAGVVLGPNRNGILYGLIDPDMLLVVLLIIVLDLLYRLGSVIDAWNLARDRSVGTATTRALSSVGTLAVVLVLALSHIALAQPVIFAYDNVRAFEAGGGDASELPDVEDLGPAFAHLLQTPRPGSGSAGEPGGGSVGLDEPEGEPWTGNERLDILLIGADGGRRGSSTYLTDTMIVVSVDPRSGDVALISLPRDTSGVPLPRAWTAARNVYGATYGAKINTLYTTARLQPNLFPGSDAQRGYKALMGALSELYGLDIRYYVAVDLRGFRGAVNALGGIVVDIRTPLLDTAYPSDDGRGKLKLYEGQGFRKMNGQQALAFARSRRSTSDFDRAARQQMLVAAVREQLDLNALLAPGVLDRLARQLRTNVKTNIPARMLPSLVTLARDVNLSKRTSLVLSNLKGYSIECNACQSDGQYKLIARVPRIRSAVRNVFR